MKRGLPRYLSYLMLSAVAAFLVQGVSPPARAETIEELKKEMSRKKEAKRYRS